MYSATGSDLFHYFNDEELDFFVDLKFHDIPNTVAQAVRRIMPHRPTLMTVHAFGGMKMLRAAADAKNEHEHGTHTKLVAVTVLTHHTDPRDARIGRGKKRVGPGEKGLLNLHKNLVWMVWYALHMKQKHYGIYAVKTLS